MNSSLLLAPLALLCGCGAATAEQASAGADVEVPQAPGVRVETVQVARSDARLSLTLPGEVQGSRDAVLASALGGYVEAVLVEPGEEVRKGQALARINTRIYAAQRAQAEARLQQASDQVTRLEALGELGAEAQLSSARLDLVAAEAGLELARVQHARSVITAPFAGRVGQLDLEVGEVINPSAPVARLLTLDPVVVTVSISDKDIGAVQAGMQVQVTADARGIPVEGVLTHVDPAADLRTRTFVAEVEVPNPDHRLLPGMIASVAIDQPFAEDALVLPQEFLVTRMDGVGVFKVGPENRAVWSPVVPSMVVRDQVVVESGVAVDDVVVISGHRGLQDGDALLVARTGQCCSAGRVAW